MKLIVVPVDIPVGVSDDDDDDDVFAVPWWPHGIFDQRHLVVVVEVIVAVVLPVVTMMVAVDSHGACLDPPERYLYRW